MQPTSIPVIAGPTASGKTGVAVELCRLIGGEIISADSMQVYKHLSVGTAKPTIAELQGIPCHLIDHVSPNDQYHLGRFVEEARKCIYDIRRRGATPVLCGGTGLYIRGLIYGIFEGGEPSLEIRRALEAKCEREGLAALFTELQTVDPRSAMTYGSNDPQRIIRALEVYYTSGKPLSSFHAQDQEKPLVPANIYVMSLPRSVIYERINSRVDDMLKRGLMEEVKTYLELGHSRDNPAIKALGYRELIEAAEGNLALSAALEVMKKKSRNYAKRQQTWFRSMKKIIWVDCQELFAVDVAKQIVDDWEKSTL